MADDADHPWLLVTHEPLASGAVVTLEDAEARHVRSALRRRHGEAVVLTDGAGTVAEATLVRRSRNEVAAEVGPTRLVPRSTGPGLVLAAAVLHGQAMDWTVQKAVELGVERVLPVVCTRSQLAMGPARARSGHWQRLALQALKQCRRAWAMGVEEPIGLEELVRQRQQAPGIVAAVAGLPVSGVELGTEPLLLVGPEGGLTTMESRLLKDAGWQGLRLARHVLRAETAAVAGAALLQAALRGDLG